MAGPTAESVAELKAVFLAFASFGSGQTKVDMEGKAFAKLCKDNKLLCKAVTPTDVDLIFAKVKAKGQRKINFEEFIKGLDAIAAKKNLALQQVIDTVVACGGPIDNGTKPEAVKWHDDKSTYTGVYGRGGPTNVDMDPANLAGLCDRSSADVRGVKTSAGGGGSRRATTESIGGSRRTTTELMSGGGASATGGSRRATAETIPAARRSTTELAGRVGNMKI